MTRVYERKRGTAGPHPEIDLPGARVSRLSVLDERTTVSEAIWTAMYLPLRRPR